ncbi:MAG: YmdB family metallophosphoesterase [Bdellovibrionales bacterium]|nr:YmdB family metallophosphoesterase [Bdellovibrionales bacterium]
MVIVCFGDVFAKPGRRALAAVLPELQARYRPDFVLANAENLAGGRGVNEKSLNELLELGVNGFTGGNHTWDNPEIYDLLVREKRLFRPANLPSSSANPCPGRGYGILENNGKQLMVINLLGRVFMDSVDCPFECADQILKAQAFSGPILVDMHAETTSEKYAMGMFLDGKVTAVVGTHTHVQTSDLRMLPKGTAYITDLGMTGSFDSIIGLGATEIVRRFMTKRPQRTQPSAENPGYGCVVFKLGNGNRVEHFVRLRETVSDFEKHKGSEWPT